jgi:hypothetical protein
MSPSSSHTPGPWRADDFGLIVWGPDNFHVADIRGWGRLTGESAMRLPAAEAQAIQEANAHLIAAAPDLLELAKRVAAHFENTDAPLGAAARALIAKAEGQ